MTNKPEYQQYMQTHESLVRNPENPFRNTAKEFWDQANKEYNQDYLDSAEND